MKKVPPRNGDAFSRLQEALPGLSKSEARLAQFLILQREKIALETGTSLAEKAGVSENTVSRFFRGLGYKGISALKADLAHSQQVVQLPNVDRHLRLIDGSIASTLRNEAQGILDLSAQVARPEWSDAMALVAEADRVWITGFQTIKGLAEDFARRLLIVRGGVQSIAPHDSGLAELLPAPKKKAEKNVIILIDIVPYAAEAEPIVRFCAAQGINIVVVTDEMNHWAYAHTPHVFHAKTKVGSYLESTGPLATLLNLIVHEAASRDPVTAKARMDNWPKVLKELSLY